ncbi:response regulator [Paenibacillus sacheonensis]|uniref:Response regulator n=1 Tax=Paenibacillus sacheonensis TaxID=742054 RepID=A0A7X4YM17_9BACL|nr:response regulator [Paenibacillus sacheonensis]MBM7565900.1 two-component system response regulator YesN [Paenibacillus sacheonensis]NBC68785.1 response regulator [Paenibacillus sacheonensis]
MIRMSQFMEEDGMFKVLIADDEMHFRHYMRNVIDWQEHGFEIIGEAKNGLEALELSAQHRPHIALLDINMPFLDGIALAEKLKELHKDIHIALITGYSEFEYARKALQLGVEDYILKPFKRDDFLSTLLRFKARLQKLEEEAAQSKDDSYFLKERFLNTLIGEEYDFMEEEILHIFSRQGIRIHSPLFLVAAIEIDTMYERWSKASEIALWKFAVANVLRDIVVCKGTSLVFNGPEGKIISLLNFADEKDKSAFKASLYQEFCDYVKKYFRFSVTVGLGDEIMHMQEIRKGYLESLFALQHKLVDGSGAVLEYAAIVNSGRNADFNQMQLNDRILKALRRNERDEVQAGLQQIMKHIKDNRLSVDFTYAILMGLVSICLAHITEMGGSIDLVLGKDFYPYQELRKMSSLEKSIEWLMGIYEKTIRNYSGQMLTRSQKIVEGVKDYIHMHYMDGELNVESIAHHMYLDSSYIRKVLAKELEMNVSEYITLVRMEHAKDLLVRGNIKITELAEKVGYSKAGYFAKCFKKQYGVLPSEYSESLNPPK